MERRLAAILAADVAGFSRLAAIDEDGTLAEFARLRAEAIDPEVDGHGGRIFKTTGDGLLAAFPSVVEAVRCAARMQRAVAASEIAKPAERRILLRIGVHVGDVVVAGDDLLGDGVNVAARLERLAAPGGLCVSAAVHDQVRDRLPALRFDDGGEERLHNIPRPVHVWRLPPDASAEATGVAMTASPSANRDRPSLAVLPLVNLSGDDAQDYFSDGMTEEIITALSRFRGLVVIARHASFAMRGRDDDARRVGQALGAEYVLRGSIRRAGDRVRVSVRLLDSTSGDALWAERFDRTLVDLLDVQDEIAGRIVAAVAPQIRDVEIARARRPGRVFSKSYDLALRAQALTEEARRGSDRARMAEALDLAREATCTEPVSARAYQVLSLASLRFADLAYFAPDEVPAALASAQAAAERLAEIEPDNHMAYLLMGNIAIQQHRGADARRLFQRALDLNPNDPMVSTMLSWAEANEGLAQAAIAHASDALARTPLGRDRRMMLWTLGFAHWVAGDPAAALPFAREAVAGRKSFVQRYGVLIACLAELGQLDEAKRLLAEAEEVAPDYVRSRLEGKSWFTRPDLAARYATALRKAAGLPPLPE